MKKNIIAVIATLFVFGFLVACAEGGDDPNLPMAPDVPNEQIPEDGLDTDPGTEGEK